MLLLAWAQQATATFTFWNNPVHTYALWDANIALQNAKVNLWKNLKVSYHPTLSNSTQLRHNILLSYEKAKITSAQHDYMFVVEVKNSGNTRLTEYQVDLFFPDAFLNQTMQYGHEVYDRRTATHRMFRMSEKEYRNEPIFPGDTKRVISIPYSVNRANFDGKLMDQNVMATLRCGQDRPIDVERPIREFQIF